MSKKGYNKQALLVVDMLNDFVLKGAPLEVPSSRSIIPALQKEIDSARRMRVPVIYICDAHIPHDPEFKIWPKHAVKGTKGSQVIDKLKPQKGDIIVPKTTYSGFFRTSLERTFKKLKVRNLTLTGILTNICVLYTAADAVMRGYQVTVLKNCVSSLSIKDHNFALKQLKEVLKAEII